MGAKDDHAHGANKNHPGAAKKRGENKGILAAKKQRKRTEAEARNLKTLPERRRAARVTLQALERTTT
jgi:hypothetical protein